MLKGFDIVIVTSLYHRNGVYSDYLVQCVIDIIGVDFCRYSVVVKLLVDEVDIYIGIVFAYSDDSLRNGCVIKRIGLFIGTG